MADVAWGAIMLYRHLSKHDDNCPHSVLLLMHNTPRASLCEANIASEKDRHDDSFLKTLPLSEVDVYRCDH